MFQLSSNMQEDTCAWKNLFKNDDKSSLENGFFWTGLISALLGLWLNITIISTSLWNDFSYRNLINYTSISFMRRAVSVIYRLPLVIHYIESYDHFQNVSCELFAYSDTFFAVFEIESLTHACIERYVVAKYNTNGWPIPRWHYFLYIWLTVLFAFLYSHVALFGLGQYGHDFSCNYCTYDMVLPGSWQRNVVVGVFCLRSIKPAIFMVTMLIWARILERKYNNKFVELQGERNITKGVTALTVTNLLCWTPIFLIRGWVVFTQMLYNDFIVVPSLVYVKGAMWLHWSAPAMSTLTLFIFDGRIRENMINLGSVDNEREEEIKKKEE